MVVPLVFVLLIGWVNAFNFMDGNGITVVCAYCYYKFLPLHQDSLPLLITMDCLV
jgi:UDP-N-acetylmuramyl pentapeptide phosphotransferase/UDP-N-acetylglucosamine-1-phosphate transferase